MTQGIIDKLREFFSTQPVEKAWLFGSYARGEETSESDVDILVEYTSGKCPGLFGICKLIEDLENILKKKVDLVERGTLFPRIARTVEMEKIQIYERIR
ncbi:MAG: nucleotidyltransferase domain-containing protein [Muribaculaceae bacterium]|nr:nucleotidyltransferase domain-containing protein [Muribaculaceae bacterium]